MNSRFTSRSSLRKTEPLPPTDRVLVTTPARKIDQSWKSACLLSWTVYISFQFAIAIDHEFSEAPLCPHSSEMFGLWFREMKIAILGAYLCCWLLLLTRLIIIGRKNVSTHALLSFSIISMAASSAVLVFVDWGGVCIDVLGVAMPAALWGEWLASGPLLIYMALTVVSFHPLNKMELSFVYATFLMLLTGLFIVIPQPVPLGMLWCILSSASFLWLLYFPRYITELGFTSIVPKNMEVRIFLIAQQTQLAFFLVSIFFVIAIYYFIAAGGATSPGLAAVGFFFLSFFTKCVFVVMCLEVNNEIDVRADIKELDDERNANEARRKFMKYIFHEVRTPLNSLLMGIEFLEGSPGMGIVDHESLVAMKNAAIFMHDTLNDVLSMQKIEEGKLVLDMSSFCIASSTKNIVSIFQGALSAKNLNVTVRIDSDAPAKIIADRQRLEHTISNLLSNAIKFSLQGGAIAIVVKFEQTVDNACNKLNLLVSITDDGVGISKENQKRLFRNWVQIRPQFLQEGKGSGLGLTFCKEIVELHKGIITITSDEGKGSTFMFKIPVEIMENSMSNSPCESELTSQNSAIPNFEGTPDVLAKRKLKVLVVDDAPTNRKMLSMLLSRDGIENDVAENGQVAVNMAIKFIISPDEEANITEYPYDLIFMDNLMPVMDGVTATSLLRKQGYPHLIVGLTGNVMEDDVVEYLNVGADGVLFKPLQLITLKMLLEYVRNEGSLSLPGFYLQLGEHGVSRIPRAPRIL